MTIVTCAHERVPENIPVHGCVFTLLGWAFGARTAGLVGRTPPVRGRRPRRPAGTLQDADIVAGAAGRGRDGLSILTETGYLELGTRSTAAYTGPARQRHVMSAPIAAARTSGLSFAGRVSNRC